jgi:flagellar basal-body rod modification protein FlgD
MSTVDGLGAGVLNGKFTDAINSAELAKTTGGGSSLDNDAFLNLLVAQMKYQDPLEPTSNTEYISQFSTFTQLETMQNMNATLELSRASSYVGQIVTIRTKTATGEFREVEGKVDFVIFENNKAMVSVGGQLFNVSEVYATVDAEYKNAYDLAVAFGEALNSLPHSSNLSLSDADLIDNLRDGYNAMTSYQQSFIANSLLERLSEYVTAALILRALATYTPPTEVPAEVIGEGEEEGVEEVEGEGDETTDEQP